MTRKNAFFEGWSWFKFNNMGLLLGTNLEFYIILSKGIRLKVRKFWRLIPTFLEVTGEKLVGGGGGGGLFVSLPSWIGLSSFFPTKRVYSTIPQLCYCCLGVRRVNTDKKSNSTKIFILWILTMNLANGNFNCSRPEEPKPI